MIEYLPQALSSLSAALNIGKTLAGIRDSAKLQEAIMQFNSAIIDAQSKIISSQSEQSSLTTKVQELEKECMRLKDWSTERKRYIREQIAPGVFAYIENNFVGHFQDAHKLCCNCFDKSIQSTLQQSEIKTHRRMIRLDCSNGCHEIILPDYNDQE